MTEIQSIVENCKDCGMAIVFAIAWSDLDESGEERKGVRVERLPHVTGECQWFQKLEREQWPSLF